MLQPATQASTAMDGEGDGDDAQLKLQRESGELIREFEGSLSRFLRKSTAGVRRLVRRSKTMYLTKLLDPFQEEPQLIDRRLEQMVSPLVEAFSEFLTKHAHNYLSIAAHIKSSDTLPLPRAVCKILYTLCKIRGYKVVVRFLSGKPQLLEPMLDAFEYWNAPVGHQTPNSDFSGDGMIWEERYIMLLWMYHLSGVPFDLASLSASHEKPFVTQNAPLELPDGCPAIIARLVGVSCRYLSTASREREAAVKLLSRLALLHDWHKLRLHRTLIRWAFFELRARNNRNKAQADYTSLGLLSFLANFVSSATTVLLEPFSNDILELVQQIQPSQSSSAVSTKLMIKLYRNLALHSIDFEDDAMEKAIWYFMDQLAASDTVVRLAASKALAQIASHLDQDLAMDLVGHILESLEKDVILESNATDQSPLEPLFHSGAQFPGSEQNIRNVNALRWHGLIMTLSHFIHQRSIPSSDLLRPIDQIIKALNFVQKNALGSAVGTNVRDAACFGLWALAKKYSTAEISNASNDEQPCFQALANELIVAALLDPLGNVRRGASAALQELVGRHPDTIDCGKDLELVRIVDYHTVASRKKAMWTTLSVMKIRKDYWAWLLRGLLSWRGARFEEVESRQKSIQETHRNAALLISVFAVYPPSTRVQTIPALTYELGTTRFSQLSERRGLIWALTEVLVLFEFVGHRLRHEEMTEPEKVVCRMLGVQLASLWKILNLGIGPTVPRPQPIVEIEARLIGQLCQSSLCSQTRHTCGRVALPSSEDANICLKRLSDSLKHLEGRAAVVNGRAIQTIHVVLEAMNDYRILDFVNRCIEELSSAKGTSRYGFLAALSAAFFSCSPLVQDKIINILVDETRTHNPIELRTFSLDLMREDLVRRSFCTSAMLEIFDQSLSDYTVNRRRGDVGSHVRKAAISAVSLAIKQDLIHDFKQRDRMTARVCGLSVEKMDSVRFCAVTFLTDNWAKCGLSPAEKPEVADVTETLTFEVSAAVKVEFPETSQVASTNTVNYFERILSLCKLEWVRLAVLTGFVTTAGGEYEDQIRVSRTALINHTLQLSNSELQFFCTYLVRILRNHPDNDRLLIPAMEVIGFLFESGLAIRLEHEGFGWERLCDLITTSRLNSTNLRKLEVATRIYCALAQVEKAKPQAKAIPELCKMLKHRYPLIRNAAADALLLATGPSPDLLGVNWKRPTRENAQYLANIKLRLGVVPY